MEYQEKLNKAANLYGIMVKAYQRHLAGGVDKKSAYGKFVNAAIALAELDMPNPFMAANLADNAATRPDEGHIVTAIYEGKI